MVRILKKKHDNLLKFMCNFSVRCLQKNILRAYYIICDDCGTKDNLCSKCGQSQDTPIE